jgi:type I restriction enzyme M protein
MLDNGTKRRIDSARDILVGKIPDPKSQVEQITIALIYKFMDDMDAESEELGGSRNFFAGEFARYGWAKLMRSGLGGHETLNLYAEAIARMPENPGIPLLFRNIFKNAYLPYRDPETLRAFLKVIDEFSYDHSERLGDAFEYLLSVLGSQGDAGQFRTPRHIIDFIVAVVDPKKHETISDPACGTAGFLISSYKHILKNNLDEHGYSTLTPDEKGRMVENFSGYDISPDMVRLSLVNMYLHGFSDPQIFEYDTLTSQERWNEYADVILANPPFMSPKGGIRPHNRFSVQSKRSEVLFVDYIADHLTPEGRAGVIVPEGIIFQSQNAYKQLRKKLLEESLVAVVSLPAGVFQPYSGVKTSILILDKALAKKADTIAFFKVENDGFGLGAQRRPIDKTDLPQVLEEIKGYFDYLRVGDGSEEYLTQKGLVVKREKIAENGEYNLSGERYRETLVAVNKFSMIRLGDVCTINPDNISPLAVFPNQIIMYADITSVENYTGRFLGYKKINSSDAPSRARRGIKEQDILLSTVRPNLKAFVLLQDVPDRAIASTGFAVIRTNLDKAIPTFFHAMLCSDFAVDQMMRMMGKGAYPSINQSDVANLKIPLPPLEIQKEIVAEIESYQKVIDGARAVVENYRPHIPIDPSWSMVSLESVCDIKSGGTPSRNIDKYWNGHVPWVGSTVCKNSFVIKAEEFITEEGLNNSAAKVFPKNTTIVALVGATIGKTGLLTFECAVNQNIAGLQSNSYAILDPLYLFYSVQLLYPEFLKLGEGKFRMANLSFIRSLKIHIPPIETQKKIVEEIEAEQSIVNSNRDLIKCFEDKIGKIINQVWDEEG